MDLLLDHQKNDKKATKNLEDKPVLVSEQEARLRLKSLRALMMISCRDLSRLQQRWRASSYLMLLQSPNIFTWLCPCAAASTWAIIWENMEVYRQRRTGQDASWKEDGARAPQRANNLQAYVGASLEKCIK